MDIKFLNEQIAKCVACPLHATRTNTVPGEGSVNADVMFIGEGPGADEDIQGKPFVGRSGKLLTKIMNSVGLSREDVFITNLVKCRPPDNRNPELKEISACSNFLNSQIALINPKIIVTIGALATRAILGTKEGITKLRGQIFEWKGKKVMPLLHPSYLLRNPSIEEGKPKWLTWQDMIRVKEEIDNGRT